MRPRRSGPRRSPHIRDCYFNTSTAVCARLAAGSAADVAIRVATRAAAHGAAIIRPPGHHAESSVAMGFCYYNNAAVAARAAQAAGARRVIIMDWDVSRGGVGASGSRGGGGGGDPGVVGAGSAGGRARLGG